MNIIANGNLRVTLRAKVYDADHLWRISHRPILAGFHVALVALSKTPVSRSLEHVRLD